LKTAMYLFHADPCSQTQEHHHWIAWNPELEEELLEQTPFLVTEGGTASQAFGFPSPH